VFSLTLVKNNDGDDTVTITAAYDGLGSPAIQSFSVTSNGQEWFSVAGKSLKCIEIETSANVGIGAIGDMRHVRIGGTAVPVPLPAAAWSTLGLLGMLGVGRVLRRKAA